MSLVPKFFESEWYRGRDTVVTSAVTDWPRIGVYCLGNAMRAAGAGGSEESVGLSHASRPWLVGSFEVSSDLLEERDAIYWGWRDEFATGDGYLIHLSQGSRKSGNASRSSVPLVDDLPHTSSDRKQLLKRVQGLLEAGRYEEAQRLSSQDEAEQARLRLKISMECRRCDQRLERRLESVQDPLSKMWAVGFREISIDYLRRAIEVASR